MNTQEVVASTEDMMLPATVAAYEELSRLSDAQLEHRALRRDTLARDLTA
jgi:hypothetical protein